jgi:hypothetical protein
MEVEKSAARAAEIANELAVFSRQEKETRRLPPGNLNMVATVAWIFSATRTVRKSCGRSNRNGNLFGARFDEAKVQQALTKILENAVEAVGLGGQGQITVQTRNVDLTEPTQDRNVQLAAGRLRLRRDQRTTAAASSRKCCRAFSNRFLRRRASKHRGLGLALGLRHRDQPRRRRGGFQPAGHGHFGAGLSAGGKKIRPRKRQGSDENLHGTETILMVDDEDCC